MPQKDTLYGDLFVVGNLEANLIKKTGGTSSQFLKADGSVDSNSYLTSVPTLDQVTTAGNTTTNAITVGALNVNISGVDRVKLGTGLIEIYDAGNVRRFFAGTSGPSGQLLIDSGGSWDVNFLGGGFKYLRTGNFGIGTTTDAGYKLDVNGTTRFIGVSLIRESSATSVGLDFTAGNLPNIKFTGNTGSTFLSGRGKGIGVFNTATDPTAKFQVGGIYAASTALATGLYVNTELQATANNDTLVGLDINPTFTNGAFTGIANYGVRIQSSTSLITNDINSVTRLQISNISSGNQASTEFWLTSNGGTASWSKWSSNRTTYKIQKANDAGLYNGTAGDITFLNDVSIGKILFSAGGSATAQVTLFSNGNLGIGTTTDAGQKLQISGSIFIKGTTSLTATKIFEVQNGSGTSIMDFRDNQYAFFGCGQGGGSASGFIFNYSNTSYTQFSGYNYGAGAGSYKPILMDTDGGGRNQGIFVNFGVTTNTPPSSDTEFAVRGRTSNSSTYISKFVDSSNVERFSIRADGALFTDGNIGYTGTVNFPTNPPGQQNIDIVNGMIVNVF